MTNSQERRRIRREIEREAGGKDALRQQFHDDLKAAGDIARKAEESQKQVQQPVGSSAVTSSLGGYGGRRYEREPNLNGTRKYEFYEQMQLTSPIIAAAAHALYDLLGTAEWTFLPPEGMEEDAEAIRLAELSRKLLLEETTTPFRRLVMQMAEYKFMGFSLHEVGYELREDGLYGVRNFYYRPQRTITEFGVNLDGGVYGFRQRIPSTGQEIFMPIYRCVYLRDNHRYPEGVGLLREVVKPYSEVIQYQQLLSTGYATDMRGLPIMRIPEAEMKMAGLSDAEIQERMRPFQKLLREFRGDPGAGVMLDSSLYYGRGPDGRPTTARQFDFELVQGDSKSFVPLQESIDGLNRSIARVMGVEQLLLGEGDRGSFSLSRDKTQQFSLHVDGAADYIGDAIRDGVLREIFGLNGWNMDYLPQIRASVTRYLHETDAIAILEGLSRLNPDDPAVDFYRSEIGAPPLPDDVDMMRSMPSAPEFDENGQGRLV